MIKPHQPLDRCTCQFMPNTKWNTPTGHMEGCPQHAIELGKRPRAGKQPGPEHVRDIMRRYFGHLDVGAVVSTGIGKPIDLGKCVYCGGTPGGFRQAFEPLCFARMRIAALALEQAEAVGKCFIGDLNGTAFEEHVKLAMAMKPVYPLDDPEHHPIEPPARLQCVDCGETGECLAGCPSRLPDPAVEVRPFNPVVEDYVVDEDLGDPNPGGD